MDMFGAQIYMAEWNFLQSLMLLQSAQVKLSAWTNPAPPSSQVSVSTTLVHLIMLALSVSDLICFICFVGFQEHVYLFL